jgi:hypothetical protein
MTSNVHRAAFVRRMRENPSRMGSSTARKRAGKRLAAFNAARKRGLSKASASRSATRAVGGGKRRTMRRNYNRPQTAAQKARFDASYEATFGGKGKGKGGKAKGKKRAGPKSAEALQKKADAITVQAKTAADREAKNADKLKVKADKLAARAKTAADKAAAAKTPEARAKARARARRKSFGRQYGKVKVTKRVRTKFGPYRRARLQDWRSGQRTHSYTYRGKDGYRKIPEWAVAGAVSPRDYRTSEGKGKGRTYKYASDYEKARTRILARRKAAAKRVESGRDAFTPNAGAKGMAKAKKKKSKSKKPKAAASAKPRKRAKRAKGAKRAKKKTAKKGARKGASRGTKVGRRKVRRLKKGLWLVKNPRRRRRVHRRRHAGKRHLTSNRKYGRRHSRRQYALRRNYRRNGFTADLMTLLKLSGLVLVGFFAHRSLTGALTRALTSTEAATGVVKFAGMNTIGTDGKPTFLATWQKPLTGLVVAAAGVAGLSLIKQVKPETRTALGAGMVTSLLQNVVVTALIVAEQPKALSYLEGYSNSPAYGLRGTRRTAAQKARGVRGMGAAKASIMPRHVPIGAFQQAAAGMGEYFAQSGMGEYFAGPGLQGVGHYEAAGPLALQPARSRMGQLPIDDGIRPDSNLDAVLDLAESAAGLGQGFQQAAAGMGFQSAEAGMGRVRGRRGAHGMGEFFTASPSNGGFAESTVPTDSQWIPNGPMWAGTIDADATKQESTIAAGILQTAGGNGVLSG